MPMWEGRTGLAARLRPISGFEEELIAASAGTANTAALCNEVLARCLVPAGHDAAAARTLVAALPLAERDGALVALRRISYGDRVVSEVTCPACDAVSEIDFDLAQLPLPEAPAPVRVTIEVGGQGVHARLPTAGDQAACIDAAANAAERRTALLVRVLEAVGDQAGPFDASAVRALPSALRMAVEQAIEDAMPDLDLAMDVTCSSCDAAFTAPIELASFFFFEMKAHARRLLREIHTLAREYHWAERDILALARSRRQSYLALIEAEHDAGLIAGAL